MCDIPQIKSELKQRVVDLVQVLAPGGTFKGQYYVPRNPTRNDHRPGSFFIWVKGDRIGAWVESSSGEKGDIIDLIAYCMRFAERGAALKWAAEWIGGEQVARPEPTPLTDKGGGDRRDLTKKRDAAFRWFMGARPLAGTLAETYMASRGIELPPGMDWSQSLRFIARAPHPYAGKMFPCMIAAYSGAAGSLMATHRTFLAPDGRGKAPVAEPRLSWPDYRGGGDPAARRRGRKPRSKNRRR